MVYAIQSMEAAGPAITIPSQTGIGRRRGLSALLYIIAIVLLFPIVSRAESPAARNREGNRLFAQGRYEDAEKAYLEAQGSRPGRPEIMYNLGNSLIKQNKHDRGIQVLRLAIGSGTREIKESSWYNTGNALFSAGNYKESAEAYIQALRLNPADNDAKHNLEMAIRKLNEQKKIGSNQKPNPNASAENKQPKGNSPQSGENSEKQPKESEKPQPRQAPQVPGSVTREQAMQILDALQNQESEQQRKLLDLRARQRASGKDW
jgi:Ca-activated chloride channel homolog